MPGSSRDRPAIREKDRGIWQTWTWRQYHDQVRDFALGLAALGVRRGDRLSVIGDNRPRLYAAQLAVQCLGGVSVAVYQDSIAKELAFVWNHAEVSVIVAEDQEQVDKVMALRPELPALRVVIYDDPRGMIGYRHDWLKSFQDVQEAGRKFGAEHPGYFEAEIDKGRADDVAIVCYTSGTTGNPKGAMITHANAIGVAEIFCRQERVVAGGHLAGVPAHGVGRRRGLHALREPGRRVLHQLPGEPGDGAAGPPRAGAHDGARAAADLGEHAHGDPGAGGRRHAAQAAHLQLFPVRRRARRDPALGRQARPGRAAPGDGARRVLRLRPRARPARAEPGEVGAHRRRAARPGHVSVLPLHRRQSQAGLRVDGDERPRLAPAGHRGEPDQRGPPGAGRRGQDRRPRRGARARLLGVQGLPQERGRHARGHRPRRAGSTPGTPGSSTRAGTWSSSTGPRTSAPSPTARPSRRSSSRTSSSSARSSARRWPSATSGRSWRPWSPSISARWGTGPSAAGWRTRPTWTCPRRPRCGSSSPTRSGSATRRCRRRRRSGASCC